MAHDKSALDAIACVNKHLNQGFTQSEVLAAGWNNDSAFIIIKNGDYLECCCNDGELNAHPIFESNSQAEADDWKNQIEGLELYQQELA